MTGATAPNRSAGVPRSGRLAGKVAAITGTAGGQGRAAALLFAAEGAVVVGCDLDGERNAETAALVAAQGGTMTSSVVDLTDEDAVAAWATEMLSAHGHVDVLYANAAATRFGPVDQIPLEDWHFTLTHELDVVFLPVKHLWRALCASGSGAIVLVGSTAGVTGSTTNSRVAHTVTKGGIVALTKQLAAEGAQHGLRVNCVSPGMIRTPATERDLLAPDHPMNTIWKAIPLGRIGTPEEVVRCSLFLASDEASYVTGANLMVDGGWSAVLPA